MLIQRDNAANVVSQHKPITVLKIGKCHTKEKINSNAQQQIDFFIFLFCGTQAARTSQRTDREGKEAAGNLQHLQAFRENEGFTAARW